MLDFFGNSINWVLDVEGNSSECDSGHSVTNALSKSNSSNIELSRSCIPVHLNADLILIWVDALSQEKQISGARLYMVISFSWFWIIYEFIDCKK